MKSNYVKIVVIAVVVMGGLTAVGYLMHNIGII
jgi:hypothetical protein